MLPQLLYLEKQLWSQSFIACNKSWGPTDKHVFHWLSTHRVSGVCLLFPLQQRHIQPFGQLKERETRERENYRDGKETKYRGSRIIQRHENWNEMWLWQEGYNRTHHNLGCSFNTQTYETWWTFRIALIDEHADCSLVTNNFVYRNNMKVEKVAM